MDQGASLRGALLRRLQRLRDPAVVMEAATSTKNASYQPHRLYLQRMLAWICRTSRRHTVYAVRPGIVPDQVWPSNLRRLHSG